jgi:hypothetical protein
MDTFDVGRDHIGQFQQTIETADRQTPSSIFKYENSHCFSSNGNASNEDRTCTRHENTRAREALFWIDPSCAREDWVRIGMSARAAGLTLDDFTSWSAQGANFAGERDCALVWRSFHDGPVTAATLFAFARNQGWRDSKNWQAPPLARRIRHSSSTTKATPPTLRERTDTEMAVEIWSRCQPAPTDHPYITRKGGLPAGLGLYPADAQPLIIRGQNVAEFLVVPCHDLDGNLQTLQFISESGDKLNLPGASFGEGCFLIGEITELIYVVEGIGQAWACNAATDRSVAVAFGASRMPKIATAIRTKYPSVRLVLVPDRGKELRAAEIARDIKGAWCELPDDKPSNYDINDFAFEFGVDALTALLMHPMEPPKPESRFKLLRSEDLHALPSLQWRIYGVLPAAGLAALFGPSASGKTFLALDMAAAVAGGNHWFNYRVEAAPVVYAALEGEAGIRLRVAAWEAHHERKLPDGLQMMLQPFKLTDTQDVHDLAAVIPAGAVVFIDTLNRAAPTADENSSRDMGEILEAAKRLQAMTGGLVVLVHHTGKDATKGLRGHSSLFAAMDAAIEVSRDGDRREWKVTKAKDGRDGDSQAFKLQVETLDIDEHGDLITSCVVVADTAADDIKKVKLPQGDNQRLVLEALRPLFKAGVTGRPGAPATRPCIELEAAVSAGATNLTCSADKRTSRTRQAIKGLVRRGVMGCQGGWVWLI